MSLRWWRFTPKTVVAPRLWCDGGIRASNGNAPRQLLVRPSSPTQDALCGTQLGRRLENVPHSNTINLFHLPRLSQGIRAQWGNSAAVEKMYTFFSQCLSIAAWTLLDRKNSSILPERRTDSVAMELGHYGIDVAELVETRFAGDVNLMWTTTLSTPRTTRLLLTKYHWQLVICCSGTDRMVLLFNVFIENERMNRVGAYM